MNQKYWISPMYTYIKNYSQTHHLVRAQYLIANVRVCVHCHVNMSKFCFKMANLTLHKCCKFIQREGHTLATMNEQSHFPTLSTDNCFLGWPKLGDATNFWKRWLKLWRTTVFLFLADSNSHHKHVCVCNSKWWQSKSDVNPCDNLGTFCRTPLTK